MILNRPAGLGRRKVADGLRHRSVSAPTESVDPTRERADARCLTAPDLCSWPPTSHPQPPSPRYTIHLQPTAARAHAYYDSTCFDRVPEQSGLPLSSPSLCVRTPLKKTTATNVDPLLHCVYPPDAPSNKNFCSVQVCTRYLFRYSCSRCEYLLISARRSCVRMYYYSCRS